MSENQNNILEVKQKTVAGMFWRFAERILAQGVNIVVSIILARILMPEEYSIVAFILIIINLANGLVTSGLGTSLIQKKEADELDFSTMFYTGLLFSIIIYIILFFSAPLIAKFCKQPLLLPIIRVIALRLPIAAINSVQHAYISKHLMFRKFFWATLVGTVISAFVGIKMALEGFGAWALVGQYLTNVTIDTIMLFITVKWRPKLLFSYERMKTLLAYSWKITAASFIGSICDQLKGLIIGVKYTSVDLSFSSQGEKIPTFLSSNVETTLDSVLFPTMVIFQDDKQKMKAAIRRSMKTSAYIIMPIMFGLAAIAENLVLLILSKEWIECVPYMKIVSIQRVFGIIGIVNLQALKAVGRSDITLKLEFIKKPIYFLILICTMQISPLVMVIGGACYTIIGSMINAVPSIKILQYTIKEQVEDISVPFAMSIIMYIMVNNVGKINVTTPIVLLIQIIVGMIFYVSISKFFHIESFDYIWKLVCEFIYKKNGLHGGKDD